MIQKYKLKSEKCLKCVCVWFFCIGSTQNDIMQVSIKWYMVENVRPRRQMIENVRPSS